MTYKKRKTTRNSKRLRGSKRRFKGGDPEAGSESAPAPERKTWSSWLWGTSKAVGNSTAKTAENTTLWGMFYKMIKPSDTPKPETPGPQKSETNTDTNTNTNDQKETKESSEETIVNQDVSPQAPQVVDTQSTEAPPKTGGRRRQKRKTTKRK